MTSKDNANTTETGDSNSDKTGRNMDESKPTASTPNSNSPNVASAITTSPTKHAMSGTSMSQQEIVTKYKAMRLELQQLASKAGELEAERDEHKY